MSVCIPTYNRADLLPIALASALDQSRSPSEVLVYDDGSTDATARVMEGFLRDGRVRYWRGAHNRGVAYARNVLLDAARGEFIAWLDSDDRYHPHMLATQVGLLERHRTAVMAHGGCRVVDRAGHALPAWPLHKPRGGCVRGRDALRELLVENHVMAPTVVVRRLAYDCVGPYAEMLRVAEDWHMWLRLAAAGDVAYTPEPVADYRYHRDSLTRGAEVAAADVDADVRTVLDVLRTGAAELGGSDTAAAARASLVVKATRAAVHAHAVGHGARAHRLALLGLRLAPRGTRWQCLRLAAALAAHRELAMHRRSRELHRRLVRVLRGTQVGARLEAQVAVDPDYEAGLREVGLIVRRTVPAAGRVAVIDKNDPTVLHFSRRRGRHFPDLRLMPGYPATGAEALDHLELLVQRGIGHLVVPEAARWWLDYYAELGTYLGRCPEVHSGPLCTIYAVGGGDGAPRRGAG